MDFYLISTDHLETRLWFADDRDYACGMNYVAICAFRVKVNVVAFILMSNHVHFILECERSQAEDFINLFKRLYSMYYHRRYGKKEFLRRNKVDYQLLTLEGESLERGIAYVQCNSVSARLCAHPSGYQWGTGAIFFNAFTPSSRSITSISRRSRERLLHSTLDYNVDWQIGDGGYILPSSYVCVQFVESLFRSPARYQYYLDNSSKARRVRDQIAPSFSDQLVHTAALNLCHSLFRANSIDDLSPSQTAELVIQLRRRFTSDPAQISRATGVIIQDVARILDSF
ncbi:MAG: transposase [Bacteroidales bacterium]|nr:transposase [Bacteroidales bacterium]